ncbi:L-type lectin-domain containing receptor kinase IX.1-like protein, partial [Tanacetum coccineum]
MSGKDNTSKINEIGSTTHFQCPILKWANYTTWAIRMQIILEAIGRLKTFEERIKVKKGKAFEDQDKLLFAKHNDNDLEVDKRNEQPPNPLIPNPDPVLRNNINVGLIIGVPLSVTFLGFLLYILWRMRKNKSKAEEAEETGFDVEMNNKFEKGTGSKRFSYNELARSTCDFAETEKLGEGGFGGVYRGFLLDSKTHVAVKRVSKTSKQGVKEYASEVMIISQLR